MRRGGAGVICHCVISSRTFPEAVPPATPIRNGVRTPAPLGRRGLEGGLNESAIITQSGCGLLLIIAAFIKKLRNCANCPSNYDYR